MIRHSVRLILLGNAALTLLEFVLSPVAGVYPAAARYLVPLLISLPALIAPLWGLARDNEELQEIAPRMSLAASQSRETRLPLVRRGLRVTGLLFIAGVLLVGTINIFFQLPTAQATNQGQQKLIHDLLGMHITHLYTDFWSCYRLAFLSNEQLICVVVDGHMQKSNKGPTGYYGTVTSDPRAAYVFPVGFVQLSLLAKQAALNPGSYRSFSLDGYVVYLPLNATTTRVTNSP